MDNHYISLIFGYIISIGLWFLLDKLFPSLWGDIKPRHIFKKPYLEFIYSIVAVLFVLIIGQLYNRGFLLSDKGNIILNSINQLIIFSPSILLILIRKQSLDTIWLPVNKMAFSLLLGFSLAICSLLVYKLTSSKVIEFKDLLLKVYHFRNFSYAVQIFLEDITIALIFVRLSSWIGNKWTIIIVAILFSAGHIPTMLSNGVHLAGLGTLVLDTFIGIMVLFALSKSKDIWWFWMVHFAMDMTQFISVN